MAAPDTLLRAVRGCLLAAGLVVGTGAGALAQGPGAITPERIDVALDLARLIRVPEGTATLVIGNPAVADASVQRNGLIVITGKSYGATNVLALDGRGEMLREMMVRVGRPVDRVVTVQRGLQRQTYTCAPHCEQMMMLGDDTEYFTGVGTQIGTRNGTAGGATGQAAAAPPR